MGRLAYVAFSVCCVIGLYMVAGKLGPTILVGYMRIHPLCFQSWVYRRGVQFRVAFFSVPFSPSPVTASFSLSRFIG